MLTIGEPTQRTRASMQRRPSSSGSGRLWPHIPRFERMQRIKMFSNTECRKGGASAAAAVHNGVDTCAGRRIQRAGLLLQYFLQLSVAHFLTSPVLMASSRSLSPSWRETTTGYQPQAPGSPCICYVVVLLIGLLSVSISSSCQNTRPSGICGASCTSPPRRVQRGSTTRNCYFCSVCSRVLIILESREPP